MWCGEDGWAYLVAVEDTFCRSILGWTFTHRCRAADVSPSLVEAFTTAFPYGATDHGVVVRHDNGTQFTS